MQRIMPVCLASIHRVNSSDLSAGLGRMIRPADPVDDGMEARDQRLRYHHRRPVPSHRDLLTEPPFGLAGLVTFLVYEPDDLVLVTRVIWIG